MKSKELLGLPLISIADAREVGTIGGLVINPQQKSVDLLLLEKKEGEDLQGIPFCLIEGVGDFAVTVTDSNLIINIMKIGLLKDLVEKEIRLVGSRLITNKGKYLGQVTECSLNAENGMLTELFYQEEEGEGELSIQAQEIVTIGQDVVIVSASKSSSTSKPQPKGRQFSSKERQEILQALTPSKEKEKPEKKEEEVPPPPVKEKPKKEYLEREKPISSPQEEISDPAQSIIERKRDELVGKTLIKDIKTEEGQIIARADTVITHDIYNQIQGLGYEVFIEMATSVKD